MNDKSYQLKQLTNFIWDDYNTSLEATLGKFKSLDASVAEGMMVHYISSCYPFVYSFNDFCRFINLQCDEGGDTNMHKEVLDHTRSDLEHYDLYKRDFLKHNGWKVKSNPAPFISLHNELWYAFSQTPREYYYHLLLIFEVMSTVWLGKWHDLSKHHSLDFAFLGKEHFQDDDYKQHLVSHEEVLNEIIPSKIYWVLRNAYDKIGSGFVTWFNDQLLEATENSKSYVIEKTRNIC